MAFSSSMDSSPIHTEWTLDSRTECGRDSLLTLDSLAKTLIQQLPLIATAFISTAVNSLILTPSDES